MEADAERPREVEKVREGQRQRAILDSAVDFAIIATDLGGRVTDWSAGAERILGWTADEMHGRPLDRLFVPEDRTSGRPETEMRLALSEGRAADERWHMRKDGSRFWASGELMPLRGEGEEHLGFVKILRDRTVERRDREALRSTEARLRESEDHFRHTVELNPQVTWTADPQGSITSYSSRWLELTGQAPGEPDGAGWIKALHPDDVEQTQAIFSACLASGEPVDVDYRIWAASSGEYRWMRSRAFPRQDEEGQIVRWYGVVEDDHHRKTAEIALRESEEQFRVFAQAVPNHLWAGHSNGALYWFNEQVYTYSGAKHGELDGSAWAALVHPDDLPEAAEAWARSLQTGEVYETEFQIRRADGAYRWFLVRAEPIRSRDGGVILWIGTNTDIHERKLAETAVARQYKRAWELSPVLKMVVSINGTLLSINPGFTQALGWMPEDIRGRRVADLLSPEDRTNSESRRKKLAAGESLTEYQVSDHIRSPHGLWVAFENGLCSWHSAPTRSLERLSSISGKDVILVSGDATNVFSNQRCSLFHFTDRCQYRHGQHKRLGLALACNIWHIATHELSKMDILLVTREVKRMVWLSCAMVKDRVAVVGPRSLDYLITLFRLGFDSAVCISGEGPRPCGEPINHLFVSGPMRDDQLALVTTSIGPLLSPGGVIVAVLREASQDCVISIALGRAGLVELPSSFVDSKNTLVSHRVCTPTHLAIAA